MASSPLRLGNYGAPWICCLQQHVSKALRASSITFFAFFWPIFLKRKKNQTNYLFTALRKLSLSSSAFVKFRCSYLSKIATKFISFHRWYYTICSNRIEVRWSFFLCIIFYVRKLRPYKVQGNRDILFCLLMDVSNLVLPIFSRFKNIISHTLEHQNRKNNRFGAVPWF